MYRSENRTAFLFIVPSLAGISLFFLVPFVLSLGYATGDSHGNFTGAENFIKLLSSDAFKLASVNTLKFIGVAIPLNLIIPLLIGNLLFKLSGGGWLKTLFMSPLIIPSACTAFFFQSLFMSNGLLSGFLGVTTDWLQTEHSFAIAVGVYIWRNMGYNLVLTLAGLANIPKEYYEWASIEGMGKSRMFFRITLIYLVPSLFIMFVMSFINSFKVYRELYMLAGSYPNEKIYMLQHYMNNQFNLLNYQNLTAASFIVTLLIAALVVVFFIADKKSEYAE
ncbi:MAG: sugar ABC transporter permease [Clostridiales bacterium]|jgi:multiple sugar transport system permease protein|nr:sugar ABC transporter permease [Clostridiales bacterium]